jgi:hypothetical protein
VYLTTNELDYFYCKYAVGMKLQNLSRFHVERVGSGLGSGSGKIIRIRSEDIKILVTYFLEKLCLMSFSLRLLWFPGLYYC